MPGSIPGAKTDGCPHHYSEERPQAKPPLEANLQAKFFLYSPGVLDRLEIAAPPQGCRPCPELQPCSQHYLAQTRPARTYSPPTPSKGPRACTVPSAACSSSSPPAPPRGRSLLYAQPTRPCRSPPWSSCSLLRPRPRGAARGPTLP